jgi:hypothetical protein
MDMKEKIIEILFWVIGGGTLLNVFIGSGWIGILLCILLLLSGVLLWS